MPAKKRKPVKKRAAPKTGVKAANRKIKSSGEKAIDPLHLAPGVRTSQTTI
jgi:hypothetical protein